jgi:hypothetical protein
VLAGAGPDPAGQGPDGILLAKGRTTAFRRYPFTIILHDRKAEDSVAHEHRIKIDPGSKTTGIAVVREATRKVVAAAEVPHRGQAIKAALDSRRSLRRNRRARETRYRAPRFLNRRRRDGWLPPRLESRISNVLTWVAKAPLKDATAVNATRWELFRRLVRRACRSSAARAGAPSSTARRAGCPRRTGWTPRVGASTPEVLDVAGVRPLLAEACGHGKRPRQNLDKSGSPRGEPAPRPKTSFGFRTGDIVRADIPNGKHRGMHVGRIAIRHSPSFRMGSIEVHSKYLAAVYRADGYNYSLSEAIVK